MQQRTTEWIEKADIEYHERQFKKIYRSTVVFFDWLEEIGYIRKNSKLRIMDFCSGQGANIYYMGKRYPRCTFVGIDINSDIVMKGNKFFKDNKMKNCHLEVADIYKLDEKYVAEFDGVVSFQTLSWLPDFKKPIEIISKLEAKWFALTSLFYDGYVSCTVDLTEYNTTLHPQRCKFYNIYSLPIIKKFLYKNGFSSFQFTPFEIDIDLSSLDIKRMGTYTEKLKNGRRLQISGPMLMPWYFIAARR